MIKNLQMKISINFFKYSLLTVYFNKTSEGSHLLLIEVSKKNFKFTSNFTNHPIG